jgi:hypothetical protein
VTGYTGQTPDTEPTPDWRTSAACLGLWEAMHPENDEDAIAYAKSICARCPVTRDCFWDAVATDDMRHGIRAGLRAGERRAVVAEINARRAGRQLEAA